MIPLVDRENLVFTKEMVEMSVKNYDWDLKMIQKLFENADVPVWWYNIIWKTNGQYVEETVNIAPGMDGIQVFIPQRGQVGRKKVAKDWVAAARVAAECFELKYTERVNAEIVKLQNAQT